MVGKAELINQKILKTLEGHPEGLSIIEISKILGVHRQTVSKYVLFLGAMGKGGRRDIGPVSLHYHPMHLRHLGKHQKVTT